jgi:hypothetical protein
MLEISTDQEVQAFVQRVTTGKPKLEKRTSTRQSSSLAASSTLAPPSSGANDDETTSETSTPNEIKSGKHNMHIYEETTHLPAFRPPEPGARKALPLTAFVCRIEATANWNDAGTQTTKHSWRVWPDFPAENFPFIWEIGQQPWTWRLTTRLSQ